DAVNPLRLPQIMILLLSNLIKKYSMNFSATESSRKISFSIFLVSKYDEISGLDLTDEERKYAGERMEENSMKITRINRYTETLFIVRVPLANKDKAKLAED